MDEFAQRLLNWFEHHGRHDLPWQRDATPYHVWLSEIMLQQTQVATVIPYYEKFISRFPTIQALAAAELDDVLHHWSGLGYYARARNLHKTAVQLVADNDGQFPSDVDALQLLPGIGRSTAGAIISTALGGRAAILDGNVKRVLARYHAVEGWPGKTPVAARLWELAEQHTPHERVANYTQAIMDLGATLCTRSKPMCIQCPQADDCDAKALDRISEFPGKKPKKAIPTRHTVFLIAATPSGDIVLERRPEQGIWGGLWCFPELTQVDDAQAYCLDHWGSVVRYTTQLEPIRHSFSHYHLAITPLLITLEREPDMISEGATWQAWPGSEQPAVGLAAPVSKLWQQAVQQLDC